MDMTVAKLIAKLQKMNPKALVAATNEEALEENGAAAYRGACVLLYDGNDGDVINVLDGTTLAEYSWESKEAE